MTKGERIRACFKREPVDRVPISLWRHFSGDDQTPQSLGVGSPSFAGALRM